MIRHQKGVDTFVPCLAGVVCIFLWLGHVTSMVASLRESHFGKSAVAIL